MRALGFVIGVAVIIALRTLPSCGFFRVYLWWVVCLRYVLIIRSIL